MTVPAQVLLIPAVTPDKLNSKVSAVMQVTLILCICCCIHQSGAWAANATKPTCTAPCTARMLVGTLALHHQAMLNHKATAAARAASECVHKQARTWESALSRQQVGVQQLRGQRYVQHYSDSTHPSGHYSFQRDEGGL